MAATSKAGLGHEDRRSDGGEVLESETSASEEADEEDEEDSVEDGVRDALDGCRDKSLGQLAAAATVRGRVDSTARTPSLEVLCTGRNMMECLWPLEFGVILRCGEKCTWTLDGLCFDVKDSGWSG